jgi:putative oxidoreductase
MRQIAIEEPPPLSFTLVMTTLRSISGIVVIAFAWQNWEHLAHWQVELARFGVTSPEQAAPWSLAGAILLGLGLVLGWVTRLWSFGLLCAAVSALALAYSSGSLRVGAFEYPLLIAAVSLVFVITGGGRISVDRFLFERARRRAIESSDRWLYPPYVAESQHSIESSSAE